MLEKLVRTTTKKLAGRAGRRLGLALLAGILARLGVLALAVVLARRFGPAEFGVFNFAIGASALAASFATLGWPHLFNRLFPALMRDGEWNKLRGLRSAADIVLLMSGAVAVLVLLLIGSFSEDLFRGLAYAAALTIPRALLILRKQQLAGIKKPALGLLFDQGFAAIVTFAAVLVFDIFDLLHVVAVYFGATLVGLAVTSILLRRLLPVELKRAKPVYELAKWFGIALPMVMGTMSKTMVNRMDVLMLAPLASLYAVGLYSAAWRLTYVLTFPQVVLMTVVAPLLSEAFSRGDKAKVSQIMRLSALYAWVTTLPFIAILLIAPEWVMTFVFGAEFSEAATTLMLLAAAQFFAAFTNANAAFLLMGGGERALGGVNLTVLVANIGLNFLLIPRYGANGAALAALISAASILLGQIYFARRIMKNMES